MDIKPKQGRYTWTNKRKGVNHITARLDRFLVQISLLLEGNLLQSQILANLAFDHKPTLLSLHNIKNLHSIPFRYSPHWFSIPRFSETIENAWGLLVTSSLCFVWEQKIKNTKVTLKERVKSNTKTPTMTRQETISSLLSTQMDMERKIMESNDLEYEVKLQSITFQYFCKEEEYWRLKSHNTWLKFGDKNTAFFHR